MGDSRSIDLAPLSALENLLSLGISNCQKCV
jgi:hypothetical protein